jgi:uncharacterized protein YbbK (DUF523 family)
MAEEEVALEVVESEDEIIDVKPKPVIEKQKRTRKMTPELLDKLAIAREKAKIAQQKNKEIKQLEREVEKKEKDIERKKKVDNIK